MHDEPSPSGEERARIDPGEAAKALEEWVAMHAEALKSINTVEAVRETREGH